MARTNGNRVHFTVVSLEVVLAENKDGTVAAKTNDNVKSCVTATSIKRSFQQLKRVDNVGNSPRDLFGVLFNQAIEELQYKVILSKNHKNEG
jgi:hypothetical protein